MGSIHSFNFSGHWELGIMQWSDETHCNDLLE